MSFFEKVILRISPGWALNREVSRVRHDHIKRQFSGASRTRRTKNWRAGSTSQNAEIAFSIETLRNRTRDLVRNNTYAARAVSVIVSNLVGTGIVANFKSKLDEKGAAKFQDGFKDWAEGLGCDFDELLNFYGLQEMVARTLVESGEVLIRRIRTNKGKDAIGTELQVLEPDFLDHLKNQILPDGGYIMLGIEFSKDGKVRGYWLYDRHPGQVEGGIKFASFKSQFVPKSEVLHVFRPLRPGQIRGIPEGCSAIIELRDFDENKDAQLVKQKIAACFTAFIEDSEVPMDIAPGKADDDELTEMGPGSIMNVPRGKKIVFGNPPAISGFKETADVSLHSIAAGWNVPYELLTGDLSGVNYSSARYGWNEFVRQMEMLRWNIFIPRFCARVADWVEEERAIRGVVVKGLKRTWTPPRIVGIDPTREILPKIAEIRAGLNTISEANREQGRDPKDVMQEWAEDAKLMDKLGLVFDTDPRQLSKSGLLQQIPFDPNKTDQAA